MIDIDGSYGEGGGQMLRTSVALSAVTGISVRVTNIRANRPNPGLRAQHLTSVGAVSRLCDAKVEGLRLGAKEITFVPGEILGGGLELDIGTAGSTMLALQSCMIAATAAKMSVEIVLRGGTDVRWSPPYDYMRLVHLPIARMFGIACELELETRGFYPEGGGEVRAEINPAPGLRGVVLEDMGQFESVEGVVFAQNLPDHVVKRMKHAALKRMIDLKSVKVDSVLTEGTSTGAGIVLVAKYRRGALGASMLGERGVRAETLGENCASDLIDTMRCGATVDEHMLDQVVPYMALAEGPSLVLADELTGHAKTNIWVAEKLTGRSFTVRQKGDLVEISVD